VVKIVDKTGNPAGSVTVTGKWSGLIRATVTGTTTASGSVTFTSKSTTKRGSLSFTVTGVAKSGCSYDNSLNVETSDSVTIP
jgi:hypothetical protein